MKQSKVFFNDDTNEKLQLLGFKNKTDKIKTASFIVEDYFRLSEQLNETQLELTRVLLEGENE